jgi:acyl-coenzyme A thioesterase PaaI-like protein
MPRLLESALWRRAFRHVVNLYGPYLLAGVHVEHVADDLSEIRVRLAMRPWNRNYVGTHFGGSLFAMADPWFMIMLLERLGPGYVVWDKRGAIRFRKPGRGTVRARFELPAARVDEIRRAADADGRTEPVFTAEIVDAAGDVVAEVEKAISVRSRAARIPETTAGGQDRS